VTEKQWLKCDDPRAMLKFLRPRTSGRKLRLFAAACWRCRCREMSSFKQVHQVVLKAERLADGEYKPKGNDDNWILLGKNPYHIATETLGIIATLRGKGNVPPEEQIALLRDIFGNPFRPAVPEPAWLTSDVRTLARGIYDEKAYDRMPILADALQDAGCNNEEVLAHCRDSKQVHVRGCWVVDALVGKG
jgi:hypothetical protein